MLLYDRIYEEISHLLNRWGKESFEANLNVSEECVWEGLRKAVVYEISDVAPLFKDYFAESSKFAPRNPPFDAVWTEWAHPTDDGFFRIGCLIQKTGNGEEWKEWLTEDDHARHSKNWATWTDMLGSATDDTVIWEARVFRYLEAFSEPKNEEDAAIFKGLNYLLKKITADPGVFYFHLSADGSKISPFSVRFPEGSGVDGIFRFIGWGPEEKDICADPFILPWQPFMAFALLHCKNVVTEEHTPDAKTQRRAARAGNPPRVTYKTLRIEVPASVQRHGVYEGDEEDTGPKVRFHLCSGHLKYLTSERYKNKRGQWIWCPAHYKGSKELGEVHKRYALTPQTPKEPS